MIKDKQPFRCTLDQILNLWKDQEKYVDFLESKLNPSDSKDEKVSVQHNPIKVDIKF